MYDWNILATVREGRMFGARSFLREFGPVHKSDFRNILVMKTDDIPLFMEKLRARMEEIPEASSLVGRIVPATHTLTFTSSEIFESRVKGIVSDWIPNLASKSFHVRIHRRGFKGRLSGIDEERFLDAFLLESLEKEGNPGRITFIDPDVIIAIETIAQRAGLALFTREDLQRYPYLRLD